MFSVMSVREFVGSRVSFENVANTLSSFAGWQNLAYNLSSDADVLS
jgi:hypothetical protein